MTTSSRDVGNGGGSTSRISRRGFLTASGVAAAVAFSPGVSTANPSAAYRRPRDYPFTLGVASGDPLPDSVVLWTRLAPEPLDPFGGMDRRLVPVHWKMAEDERMRKIVRNGTSIARPEYVHSVHVDVKGLEPGRKYYYQFKAGADLSPVGRTRTAPKYGKEANSLSFAFASCQRYRDAGGRYAAYQDMARQDLDFVIHVGDYIYEELPGSGSAQTLDEYRFLHALYKTSPELQQAHAAFPWLVTLDDHEIVNNWADDDHPSAPSEDFLVRRANAFRAYWEHLPLRPSREPNGPNLPLYRRFTFGGLAEFNVLDTRQYRDDQACAQAGIVEPCDELRDPGRTMTGHEQERWLFENLQNSMSRWNVLAQQTIMAPIDYDPGTGEMFQIDQWDGYPFARDRILAFITRQRPSNPVVLSGDWHSSWVNDISREVDDPDSQTIATEFVGTSISTSNIDTLDTPEKRAANPHVKFYDAKHHGYVRCNVTPKEWRSDYRVVTDPGDLTEEPRTLTSWTIENGHPGAQPA